MPVTILLKALGNSAEFILNYFYNIDKVIIEDKKFILLLTILLSVRNAPEDIKDPGSSK